MVGCSMYGCKSNNNKKLKINRNKPYCGVKFFRFPKDKHISQVWVQRCRRKDKFNLKHSYICSLHFRPDHYLRNMRQQLPNYAPKSTKHLKPDAIPTENLPCISALQEIERERSEQALKRNMKSIVSELLKKGKRRRRRAEKLPANEIQLPVEESMNDLTLVVRKFLDSFENDAAFETDSVADNQLDMDSSIYDDEITEDEDFFESNNELAMSNFWDRSIESGNYDRHSQKIIGNLISKLKALENKCYELEVENQILSKMFTKTQKLKLIGDSNIYWEFEDLLQAFELYSNGPNVYPLLLEKGYPLPDINTLNNFASKCLVVPLT